MIFEVKDGGFSYGGQRILDSVSFSVQEPEILCVLGANGAGKTTLLRCMLGLLPWQEGASYLNGKETGKLRAKEFWRQVGYVPQAKPTSFVYSVEEMAALGRSAHLREWEQPGPKDMQKVDQALETVGIAHLKGKLCSEISGGEYQLVMIARALAGEPALLVLDEPESNLDFKNQGIVLETVARLCRERGIGAVINTHYPAHALDISQKALLLGGGKALFGDTKAVLCEENLERAFDVPVRIRRVQLPEGEATGVFCVPHGQK